MITTGSKLLIGSAVLAALAAIAYGVVQGGALGTIGLVSATLALTLIAGVNIHARDSNVSAKNPAVFESSAAAQATARPSLWPLLMGIGVTTLTLGLMTYRAIFMIGLIVIIAAAVEWIIQGWSERASSDAEYNSRARHQMIDPLEMPVAGAILAAIIVFSFSRVMLGVPTKTATVIAFVVVASLVLIIGSLISMHGGVSGAALTGTLSIVAIALVAGGAVAGLNGEREVHPHLTTTALAETNQCGVEETEADHNASQTVAMKSNLAAEITLADDSLEYIVPGYQGDYDALIVTRANPTNVFFRNESEHEARLVLELHPVEGSESPERMCTALVEEGGTQMLTFQIDQPSSAVDGGYAFTVPGSDAVLEVVVP